MQPAPGRGEEGGGEPAGQSVRRHGGRLLQARAQEIQEKGSRGMNIANRPVQYIVKNSHVVMFEMLKYYGFRCSYFILPFMQHPVWWPGAWSEPKLTNSEPMITSSDPKVTSSDPKVTSSDPKVTYSNLQWP